MNFKVSPTQTILEFYDLSACALCQSFLVSPAFKSHFSLCLCKHTLRNLWSDAKGVKLSLCERLTSAVVTIIVFLFKDWDGWFRVHVWALLCYYTQRWLLWRTLSCLYQRCGWIRKLATPSKSLKVFLPCFRGCTFQKSIKSWLMNVHPNLIILMRLCVSCLIEKGSLTECPSHS